MILQAEEARVRYKPEVIDYLLIAEAPPPAHSKRFFYYEHVTAGDSLFIATMRALYSDCKFTPAKQIRSRKLHLLKRFRDHQCYLIDASDEPMHSTGTDPKTRELRPHVPSLITKIPPLLSDHTSIILISVPVFNACHQRLVDEGFPIANNGPIDFPLGLGYNAYIDILPKFVKIPPPSSR